jgi:hypothetical protein
VWGVTMDEFVARNVLPEFRPVVAAIRSLTRERAPDAQELIKDVVTLQSEPSGERSAAGAKSPTVLEIPNGFEDPCGRVEYGSGPKGPLTQRSINRLGGSPIVFSEPSHFTKR